MPNNNNSNNRPAAHFALSELEKEKETGELTHPPKRKNKRRIDRMSGRVVVRRAGCADQLIDAAYAVNK